MNKKEQEILLIAQEECAEVTQAISKVFRFGLDASYLDKTNLERLTEEVGDLHCMIELMVESGLIDRLQLFNASSIKKQKLLKWSQIFESEDV